MSSIAPEATESLTITRENAVDALDALLHDEQRLVEQMHAATTPAELAGLYRRAAANEEQQARAWEFHPGRSRDNQPSAARCRHEAHLLAIAAEIEELRAAAAERGRDLPDPKSLLAPYADGYAPCPSGALDALIALYTAAAGGTA